MKKYMISILYGNCQATNNEVNEEELMMKFGEWTKNLGDHFMSTHALKMGVGHRLKMQDGEIQDGPYTETKESIGGFYIVKADSLSHASELAKDCPYLLYRNGELEIREVEF